MSREAPIFSHSRTGLVVSCLYARCRRAFLQLIFAFILSLYDHLLTHNTHQFSLLIKIY